MALDYAAGQAFAGYLNHVHNRIHPLFTLGYLLHLSEQPGSARPGESRLETTLEIVLNQARGEIVRMTVLSSSGVASFDKAVLDSVSNGAPYGAPPAVILSPDGNLYLHWTFHRHPLLACSPYFARPYLLSRPTSFSESGSSDSNRRVPATAP